MPSQNKESKLPYLVREIAFGIEVFLRGRSTGASCKTAFILCDDYTELVTKLYLVERYTAWGGKEPDTFLDYEAVMAKAIESLAAAKHRDIGKIKELQGRMKGRREHRNSFFHSTRLLDLTIMAEQCVDAFLDLCEYGALLFWDTWETTSSGAARYSVLHLMLRIDRHSRTRPWVGDKLAQIMSGFPRNQATFAKKGNHVVRYPADDYFVMCAIYADSTSRLSLESLLNIA